jgi:alpha-N-acetylglucosamine transferase
MPHAAVSLITDSDVENPHYDRIIQVDSVDDSDWKLANDWLVYQHSPYERTIKLEADMYIPRSIDYWWDTLADRDLNICTTARDYKNSIDTYGFYRRMYSFNKIPDTYNAITYFRKSKTAEAFYEQVKDIFANWQEYGALLKANPEERVTTDTAYSVAAHIIGPELCTMPSFKEFSMVHMKEMVIGTRTSKWYDQLTYEIHPEVLRIHTVPQLYPIHYHVKEFGYIIDRELKQHGK